MENGQLYEFIKTELHEIKDQMNMMLLRMQNLENEVAFLKGKHEGFGKFKDSILTIYAILMTGIAIYSFFFLDGK